MTPAFHQRAVYSFGVSNQVSTDLISDSPSDFTYDSTTNLQRHYASYQADVHLARAAHADHLLTILADWNGERIHLTDRMAFDPADADSLFEPARDKVYRHPTFYDIPDEVKTL